MANMWVTLNSVKLFPSFPIEVREFSVGPVLEMANGNVRHYHRAIRREWTIPRTGSTEAERTTWRNAAVLNAAVTYIDEHGTSYTVRVVERSIPLVATVPATEGGESSTGTAEYDISITLEQLQ